MVSSSPEGVERVLFEQNPGSRTGSPHSFAVRPAARAPSGVANDTEPGDRQVPTGCLEGRGSVMALPAREHEPGRCLRRR
jgi:hypothetical protein